MYTHEGYILTVRNIGTKATGRRETRKRMGKKGKKKKKKKKKKAKLRQGSGESAGLLIERSRVRFLAGTEGKCFFLQGQLSVLTIISVSVPAPCYDYGSSTQKIPVIVPKVQVAGYS